MKILLVVFLGTFALTKNVLALSIACDSEERLDIDLPDDYIVWKLVDDTFGNDYSFELRANIEEVKLESIILLRRNGDKVDFYMNLYFFLEMKNKVTGEYPYAVSGFSLSKELAEGSQILAIYERRNANCTAESRSYKIELPYNK